MDIVELYFSNEEFSVEKERQLAEQYEQYLAYLDARAEQHEYELALEA